MPLAVSPQKLLEFFEEEFGEVDQLGIYTIKGQQKLFNSSIMHNGNGFVKFKHRSSATLALKLGQFWQFEGAILTMRGAISGEKKAKIEAITASERRQIYVSNLENSISPKEAFNKLSKLGEIQSFVFKTQNFTGGKTCFAIYANRGIAARYDGKSIKMATMDGGECEVKLLAPVVEIKQAKSKRKKIEKVVRLNPENSGGMSLSKAKRLEQKDDIDDQRGNELLRFNRHHGRPRKGGGFSERFDEPELYLQTKLMEKIAAMNIHAQNELFMKQGTQETIFDAFVNMLMNGTHYSSMNDANRVGGL
jgi:RNA recognition motif-containing protein